MKPRYYYLIISAWLIVCGGLLYTMFFLQSKSRTEVSAQNYIIAPYYKPEVFENQLPPNKKAAPSASLLKQAEVKMPILMYHYVGENIPGQSLIRKKLTINPKIFEEQLKDLTGAGYEYYFAADMPDIISGRLKPGKRSIILTFDDGYKDFYTLAFPLLKKYRAKATVFVITNTIGGQAYLDSAQIKELISSGLVEIGSHTLDHVALKEKPLLEQKRQIEESKIFLEKRFNIKINAFAYPYGSFSEETVKLVEAAGYKAAASVISGRRQSNSNLFYLSRLRPEDRAGKIFLDFVER